MFMSKRKAQAAIVDAVVSGVTWKLRYDALVDQWNALVTKVNNGHYSQPFTAGEIETLINLCHPDKHHGSERANRMTQKLLSLRSKK